MKLIESVSVTKLFILFLVNLPLIDCLLVLDQPHSGPTPPGVEFIRFAPNVTPAELYHGPTGSPDGQSIDRSERKGTKVTKTRDGSWTIPEFVSFGGISDRKFDEDAPVVSPDNRKKKIIFQKWVFVMACDRSRQSPQSGV